MSYWIASTMPNGALRSPLGIHRVLMECNVDVFTNQVAKITCLFAFVPFALATLVR